METTVLTEAITRDCGFQSSEELHNILGFYMPWGTNSELESIVLEGYNGNPAAQYIIGASLEYADRIEDALRWIDRSASKGYFPAMVKLVELE